MLEPPTRDAADAAPGGEGGAVEQAAEQAAKLRATSTRVVQAADALRERIEETERLIARAEAAHAETHRLIEQEEDQLRGTHEGIRDGRERADHGSRMLGVKGPDQPLSEPARPPAPPDARTSPHEEP
jgi:hypothetical protein